MRIRELDGLRGVAALLVVLAHFAKSDYFVYLHRFSLANLAVVMFFGLSAFLLCYLAEKKFDARKFIVARFFRIVPLYLVVVFVTLAVSTLSLYDSKDEQIGYTVERLWLVLGFVLNWRLAYGDVSPFLTEFRHFWSLCVEMQLYFVIALAFPWLRKLEAWKVIAGALVVGITLRTLTIDQPHQYYSTFAYIEVFAFCGLAGVAAARGKTLRATIWPYVVLLLVLGFVWQKIIWKHDYQLLSGFFYPIFGAILALTLPNLKSKVLSHPALVSVGLWSYGIYLWHFPVRMFVEPLSSSPAEFFSLYVGLTFLASILTYRLVEKPINDWVRSGRKARQLSAPPVFSPTQYEGRT